MSFLKNIIKKIFNKQSTTFNSDDTWNNCSTWSIDNKKKDYLSISLVSVEQEKQFEIEVFEIIYSQEYIVFTEYKKFKEYLIKEQIINSSLKYYDNIKNRRLQNILGFLEAHIRSYFYIFNEGYKYASMNNTQDLIMWRAKSYENDFNFWFEEANRECKKLEIKYLFTYNDLKKYNKEYLTY